MGDRWKIWRCFGIHSTGTESDLNTSQPQLPSQSQASTSNPCPRLEFTAKEIADFQRILECVQQVIDKYKDKFGPKAIPQEVMTILNQHSSDGERVLDQVSNALAGKSTSSDIVMEAQTVVPTILKGLGTLEWTATGISLIAYVASEIYKRWDGMHENLEDILDILEGLGKLGKHVVKLLSEGLYDDNDTLKEVIFLICGGVIWCDKHLQGGRVKRFAFVNITKETIQDLKTKIAGVATDLNLGVGIQNLGVGIQTMKDVKNLSRQITKRLAPHKLGYPSNKVGLDKKVGEILSILGVNGDFIEAGVKGVLLHGLGGIGKTTLGYAACASIPIAEGFVAQVELGENPANEQICKLQMDILARLRGEKQSIGSCKEGQEVLQKYFSQCSSPILLFIDNVLTAEDLRKLLPSELRLPDKSRMIITSRDRAVSKALNKNIACTLYPMRELNEVDSEKLFYDHLGEFPPNRKEKVTRILEVCGGFPLALELVGKQLSDEEVKKDPRAWDSAIDSLETSCQVDNGKEEDGLNGTLRWSYERLNEKTKQVFHDICCLLRDDDWELAECLGTGSELRCLVDYSLVKKKAVNRGDGFFQVEVHDLVAALSSSKSSATTRVLLKDSESFQRFLTDKSLVLKRQLFFNFYFIFNFVLKDNY